MKIEIQNGSKRQHECINTIQGKKVYIVVRMLYLIENVIADDIKKTGIILEEPYVENACCSDEIIVPFEYFNNKSREIRELNEMSDKRKSELGMLRTLRNPKILFVSKRTKQKFPEISAEFSDDTIHRAIVTLCQDTSDQPLK